MFRRNGQFIRTCLLPVVWIFKYLKYKYIILKLYVRPISHLDLVVELHASITYVEVGISKLGYSADVLVDWLVIIETEFIRRVFSALENFFVNLVTRLQPLFTATITVTLPVLFVFSFCTVGCKLLATEYMTRKLSVLGKTWLSTMPLKITSDKAISDYLLRKKQQKVKHRY